MSQDFRSEAHQTTPAEPEPSALRVPRTAKPEDYEVSPETIQKLVKIEKLTVRLVLAHRISCDASIRCAEMVSLRKKRTYAIRVLHGQYGWKQSEIRRWLRSEDIHIPQIAVRTERDLTFGSRPEELPEAEETESWAQSLAQESHDEYVRRERAGKAARAVRQDLIRAMTASGHWRNVEIAKMIGLTTASVAQIRKGTTNPKGNTGRNHYG